MLSGKAIMLLYITNEIRNIDPSAYNMDIERSLFTYFPDIIPAIPEELGFYREAKFLF